MAGAGSAGGPAAKAEIEWLIELVSEIRSARTELNVPPSAKLHLFAAGAIRRHWQMRLDRQHAMLSAAGTTGIRSQLSAFDGAGAAQVVVAGNHLRAPA